MINPVAMGPDEVEDASGEFDLGVQIVSRPPDHFRIQNRRFLRLPGVDGSQPGHNFLGNYRNLGVAVVTVVGGSELA